MSDSEEPKPCPWCGEVPPVSRKEGRNPVVGHACYVLDMQITAPLHVWNTRAAVTDYDFSMAVHDGEAWQKVRTCRIEGVRGGMNCDTTTYRLSCGHVAKVPRGVRVKHCNECGAKVVSE